MTDMFCQHLSSRAILSITGEDRQAFLQGLVSNNIDLVGAAAAVYAALLTPQGKYLHDFFVSAAHDALLLDCEAARMEDLFRRLSRHRLRAKVTLTTRDDLTVVAFWGAKGVLPKASLSALDGLVTPDPRLPAAGVRAIVNSTAVQAALATASPASYDRHRLLLGLPDGSRDMVPEKSILLEAGFHELHGVDWHKGCYMGQELTARTYYRGLIKKRLVPVRIDGPAPAPGTPILRADRDVGEMRSAGQPMDGHTLGMALLRIDAAGLAEPEAPSLQAGDARIHPQIPDWMILKPSATQSG